MSGGVPGLSVLGIDPSYTSCGYAWREQCCVAGVEADGFCGDSDIHTGTISTGPSLSTLDRQKFILDTIHELVTRSEANVVCMEGYAYGFRSQMTRAHMLAELSGLIKYHCYYKWDTSLIVVPPSSLKMFATGRGNATKKQVIGHIITRWGYGNFDKDDEADAFALMHMGEAHRSARKRRTYDEVRRNAVTKAEHIPRLL